MIQKEKAMKDLIDRFSWDSDVKVISNSIDIALKEQAKEIYSKLLKTTMEEYNYSILDLQKELLEKYT